MNISSNPFVKLINKPGFSSFAQNTMWAVGTETVLKAIARPTFTLMDKKADKDVRKFSATKEFIYQITCLSLFLAILNPYKRISFNMGKKLFNKDPGFMKFKNYKAFSKISKDEQKNNYPLIKGFIELNSIAASVVSLTILAPKVAHLGVHHILKAIGLEKNTKTQKTNPNQSSLINIDNVFQKYKKLKNSI